MEGANLALQQFKRVDVGIGRYSIRMKRDWMNWTNEGLKHRFRHVSQNTLILTATVRVR